MGVKDHLTFKEVTQTGSVCTKVWVKSWV